MSGYLPFVWAAGALVCWRHAIRVLVGGGELDGWPDVWACLFYGSIWALLWPWWLPFITARAVTRWAVGDPAGIPLGDLREGPNR